MDRVFRTSLQIRKWGRASGQVWSAQRYIWSDLPQSGPHSATRCVGCNVLQQPCRIMIGACCLHPAAGLAIRCVSR